MMKVTNQQDVRIPNPFVQTFQLFREVVTGNAGKWTLILMAVLITAGPFISGLRTALIPMYDHAIDYMLLPMEIAVSLGGPVLGYLIWSTAVAKQKTGILARAILTIAVGGFLLVLAVVLSTYFAFAASALFTIDFEVEISKDPWSYMRKAAVVGIFLGSLSGYFLTRNRESTNQPV